MAALPSKVLVITGGTSGIGLSLLERLLLETRFQFILRICILCRNMKKGEFVRSALLLSHKSAEIELVRMDTSEMRSVLKAAEVVKKKYSRIDYLYMNAGILPIKHLNILALLSRDIFFRLKTGDVILEPDNPIDEFGMPTVFATNILGHFLMLEEFLPLLKTEDTSPSKIIWTTSNNAIKNCFSVDDFMCEKGSMPYGSSKYIMNAVSLTLNNRHNKDGIYSCLAEPGLCITSINGGFIPGWLWKIAELIFKMLRIFACHFTLSTYNGAQALVWLFKQDPESLEKNFQYESSVNVFNQPYVTNARLEIQSDEAEQIYEKMCEISKDVRNRIEES